MRSGKNTAEVKQREEMSLSSFLIRQLLEDSRDLDSVPGFPPSSLSPFNYPTEQPTLKDIYGLLQLGSYVCGFGHWFIVLTKVVVVVLSSWAILIYDNI